MTATARPPLQSHVLGLIGAVLGHLRAPALLLDADGRILSCNREADALLADGRHIALTLVGTLTCKSAVAAGIVASVLPVLDGPGDDLDFAIHGESGEAPIFASLVRFQPPPHEGGYAALPPVALMFIRDGHEDEGFEAARAVYGLSEAEMLVMRAVLSGQTLSQHAKARAISAHTARKQLTTTMRKAGVSSQLQLQRAINNLLRRPQMARSPAK